MSSADIASQKQQIIEAAEVLLDSGVMSLSQHGNISARVPGTETFLLTAGGSLSGMTPDNIALFDLAGTLLDGAVLPTSAEIVDMHGVVYRLKPQMGGALHTHSPMATSFAVAGQSIPLIYEAQARFNMTDGVPVADYGPRGSRESVENIARALRSHENIGGVLCSPTTGYWRLRRRSSAPPGPTSSSRRPPYWLSTPESSGRPGSFPHRWSS